MAAGLLSSAARRLPRVWGESCEGHALAGEQQRAVEVILGERLGAEALGVRRGRLGAGAAALVERDERGDHGEGQQARDAREHHAQAAVRPLAGAPAGVQERALGRGELEIVAACPVERRGQARAAVQLAGIAAAALPFAGGGAQVATQPAPLGVLLQPAAQPRPLAQQRLVRDLDLALADGEQARRR